MFPFTTRSLATLAFLASVAALGVSLAGVWTLPCSTMRTALAASPKTHLTGVLHVRDPASARSYYLSKRPEDLATYTHPFLGFSVPYFKDFTVQHFQEDRGELVLIDNPAVGMGVQIFITPDDETEPLTATRIRHDLPDLSMDEVSEFELSDGTPAIRFLSYDPLLGALSEIWYRMDGHVFQLSVSAPDRELQDAWVRDLAAHLTFPSL